MYRKDSLEKESQWYWNSPVDGLTIEDYELIAQQIRKEDLDQEKDKNLTFAIFT